MSSARTERLSEIVLSETINYFQARGFQCSSRSDEYTGYVFHSLDGLEIQMVLGVFPLSDFGFSLRRSFTPSEIELIGNRPKPATWFGLRVMVERYANHNDLKRLSELSQPYDIFDESKTLSRARSYVSLFDRYCLSLLDRSSPNRFVVDWVSAVDDLFFLRDAILWYYSTAGSVPAFESDGPLDCVRKFIE